MNAAYARDDRHILPAAACAGLLLAAVGLPGCQSLSGGTTSSGQAASHGPPASPVQHTLLQNIPLPVGFKMVPDRSVARESGQFRVAQCEFEGVTTPEAVTRFYVQYMPTARFTLRQKRLDNGEYNLRFDSDSEECNVRVKRQDSKTILVVDIGPLPKGPTEREAQPPVPRP